MAHRCEGDTRRHFPRLTERAQEPEPQPVREHGRSDCWVGRLLQKAEGVVDGMLMMLEIELEMDR